MLSSGFSGAVTSRGFRPLPEESLDTDALESLNLNVAAGKVSRDETTKRLGQRDPEEMDAPSPSPSRSLGQHQQEVSERRSWTKVNQHRVSQTTTSPETRGWIR